MNPRMAEQRAAGGRTRPAHDAGDVRHFETRSDCNRAPKRASRPSERALDRSLPTQREPVVRCCLMRPRAAGVFAKFHSSETPESQPLELGGTGHDVATTDERLTKKHVSVP